MRKLKNAGIIIAAALIVAGLLAGFYMAYQRMRIEADSHKAEIVMDWSQLTAAARREAVGNEEMLERFLPYISGILIKEPTVYTLSDEGRAVVLGGDEMRMQMIFGSNIEIENVQPNYCYVLFYDLADAQRALTAVTGKLNAAYAELIFFDNCFVLGTSASKTELSGLGIGFDPEVLEMLDRHNLGAVVQLRDFTNLDASVIKASVEDLRGHRVIAVGFNENAVPGAAADAETWKESKAAWQEALESIGAPLLSVEFFEQKGVEGLGLAMSPDVVRMHAVSEAEMKRADIVEGAPQRYQLAVSERNIKIAFVRMLVLEDTQRSLDFVREVREAIEAKGTVIAPLSAPDKLSVPLPLLLVLVAAVCAGAYLLALRFGLGKWSLILAVLAFLGGAGLLLIGRVALVQKLFALFSVLTFPTLAVVTLLPEKGLPLGRAILRVFCTCLCSLIGAVLMIGLLADNSYMLKINSFVGVKVAHLIPVLLVLGYFFFLRDRQRDPYHKLMHSLEYRISVGFALIALLALVVMYIYLSRTGNETVSVSGVEKWLRVFLDQTLYVRPRTKEFLLGYPCLLFMYYYGYRDIYLPVLALGVIGQVSLVNTYAHIHTPIVYSLLRSLNGFWLGMLIAVAVVLLLGALGRFLRAYREKLQQNQR